MLLDVVVDELDRRCVPFALVGAAALAVHGISRSTLDIDLLVTDRRVLDATFWAALAADIERDSRPGDATDPLAGVIRFRAFEERDVDIVVGRGGWNIDVVTHAENARHHGRGLPTARMEDLILLKLYAGGSQDRWDIEVACHIGQGGGDRSGRAVARSAAPGRAATMAGAAARVSSGETRHQADDPRQSS